MGKFLEPDRPHTIRDMRIACWIPKATDTHSHYVVSTATTLTQKRRNVTFVHILPVLLICLKIKLLHGIGLIYVTKATVTKSCVLLCCYYYYRISHFSALAGKYSPILASSNQHYYYYYYYYYLLQLSCHSVAIFLTLVTNKDKYT